MGIGPILPGRIPASLMTSRLQQNLAHGNRLLLELQDQVSTGQKFFRPSEAPAAAVRTIFLQKTMERKTQMQTNVATDRSMLAATETNLSTVSDALNIAKSFTIAGVGDSASTATKQAMANEVASLITSVVNTGNTKFRRRYLFGGSESRQPPFEIMGGGMVRYNGDSRRINSFVDFDLLVANNVDGVTAFGAQSPPVGNDLNPALTLETKISDLHGGQGVKLGSITITLDNGTAETAVVDLSGAETIGDLKTLLEAAFPIASGSLTLSVDIVPGLPQNGLRLTPSAGTVTVSDLSGSTVASDLGIASAAAATITGGDLDPRLTLQTPITALNGGAGATLANGLFITNGPISKAVDVSAATNIEELLNILEAAKLDLALGINDAGNGLAISSRLSGTEFSIGENNGSDAAGLGIRTMTGATLLDDLNFGGGVPVNELDNTGTLLPALLDITRRDGTTSSVDLKGMTTVQQVIDAITAIDANITASLNAVGNGISIVDASGTGPLKIDPSAIATSLGIDGEETGSDNSVPLVGKDVNPREANGVINLLAKLEIALRNEDDHELARLDPLIDAEIERFSLVRSEIGGRLKVLDEVEDRLLDEELMIQQALSVEFDTDMTEAITQFAAVTATLQATLQLAAQSLQLSLLNFL